MKLETVEEAAIRKRKKKTEGLEHDQFIFHIDKEKLLERKKRGI